MDLCGLCIDLDERLVVRMWEAVDAPALYERVVANRSYIGAVGLWRSAGYSPVAQESMFAKNLPRPPEAR
jgi:hypothetical protein